MKINIERVYKYSNLGALILSFFLVWVCMSTDLSWWYIPAILIMPTVMFLCVVLVALGCSFILTEE